MRRSISCIALMFLGAKSFAAVADLEDKVLPPNSFYNGSDSAGGFDSHGVHFNNGFDTTFGSWSGFAYSNVNDPVTSGFFNQYAVITGAGAGGAGNYAVAYDGGAFGVPVTVTLPYTAQIQSLDITNTTYAFLAMRDGDDGGFNFARQFGDNPATPEVHGNEGYPDLFTVTIVGDDGAGHFTSPIVVKLADYTGAIVDDFVENQWRTIDLTAMGSIRNLTFTVSSTDFGTPTYFALDNVAFVPEPGSIAALALATSLFARGRRTR